MQIEQRTRGDVTIVDLTGRLVIGDAPDDLRDTIDELLAEGRRKIVLNVSELARIDSSGIGELVAALKRAQSVGARLALLQPAESVRRILDLSHVLPLFESYDDEQNALEAVSDEAPG
ncbi:MAG: STAS domain-containing protein [Thermoanaerobaculia bacterium]|nr:STAS domain-containing protein [Thermoanaerobaculia bacterium]